LSQLLCLSRIWAPAFAAPGSDPSAASAKKKAKTVWFARDDEIAKSLRSHREWSATTKKVLESTRSFMIDIMDAVPSELSGDVANEVKLCKNRLYALKLVLGGKNDDDHNEESLTEASALVPNPVVAPALTTPAGSPPKKKDVNDTEGAAAAGVVEEGAEKGEAAPALPGAAAPAAAQVVNVIGIGVGADGADDRASTVGVFLKSASGDRLKAMRKYIAGFQSATPELGHAPPCRSYRSLVCFEEFDEYTCRIEKAQSREDLAAVQLSMKAFKGALTDLITVCKSSATRVNSTVESVKKKNEAEKASSADGSRKRGRPRKDAIVGELSFVESPAGVHLGLCLGRGPRRARRAPRGCSPSSAKH
jgi:hypothetical protein